MGASQKKKNTHSVQKMECVLCVCVFLKFRRYVHTLKRTFVVFFLLLEWCGSRGINLIINKINLKK